jgi:prolyl-tRNA editing enzyme YbaK/EbsC (Cys-tRNA(Pro) deacylase)
MSKLLSELQPNVSECLKNCGIEYKVFECDPELADTAAFCEHYGFAPGQSANAIITASKTDPVKYACCVVLANSKLDVNKKVCQLLGVKKASFASSDQTLELTGMQIGGVTPFGLPDIPIYLDAAVMDNKEVVLGGGNRSSKVLLDPAELQKLPGAQVVEGLASPR